MATNRSILVFITVLMLGLGFSCAADSSRWAIGVGIPCAVSIRRVVDNGVAGEMTLSHARPFRLVLRDAFSTLTIGNTHVRFIAGAGAAVAFLCKSLAWGSCGLIAIELMLHHLPVRLLIDVVALLPWSPIAEEIEVTAELLFYWGF